MATLTIKSPGVEIVEKDVSLVAPSNNGTSVFVTGFANQGPTDEVIQISSRQDLDLIYGPPTNSAERYFYYTVRELLNSPSNIYTSRLPYGAGTGVGFGSKYSALVYPVRSVSDNTVSSNLNILSGAYVLGSPVHYELTADQYQSVVDGSGFTWSSVASAVSSINTVASFGGAGVIVLNKAQSTINDQYEGYYVGLADNTNNNPGTNFDGILAAKTINISLTGTTSSYITIPNGTLEFSLSANYLTGPGDSISKVMENIPNYDISDRKSDDLLSVGVFKLRKSIFSTESFKLAYVLEDGILGSIDAFRSVNSENSGPAVNYFVENASTNSRNVQILVNNYISNKNGSTSIDINGVPQKKIRVLTNQLVTNTDTTVTGISSTLYGTLTSAIGYADNIYSLGAFSNTTVTVKSLGDIPSKLDRALDGVRNEDIYDLDVVVEAGLGTIYAAASANGTDYYDEFTYTGTLSAQVEALRTSGTISTNGETIRGNYSTIFDKFENFCSPNYIGGGRGDCVFVADPIRQIVVTGSNSKILSNKNKNFTTDVYWAIRHQFELQNTSYGIVYGNWAKTYDTFIGQQVWVPFSGFAAAAMARTDSARFPWIAPAGFTNGLVTNSIDLAVNPNQKQRDELYRANINPVSFFPAQGQVIYGNKTLSKKPSAFDRINVRRLFLALERPTRKAAQFFVFEPNTTFTRTRLVNTLSPIFDRAKNNEGLYDYLIVCDERNNTPEVIDNNQLVVDIYIKPVKASEFILINFFATRTDASFQEIIGA